MSKGLFWDEFPMQQSDESLTPKSEPESPPAEPCIVCEDAPGTITVYVEYPSTGMTLYFPCCWACLRAAKEPEGRKRLMDAADRHGAALAGATGGTA